MSPATRAMAATGGARTHSAAMNMILSGAGAAAKD